MYLLNSPPRFLFVFVYEDLILYHRLNLCVFIENSKKWLAEKLGLQVGIKAFWYLIRYWYDYKSKLSLYKTANCTLIFSVVKVGSWKSYRIN